MEEHVYRVIELAGSSTEGVEAAVQNAVSRAARTLRHLRWFEVKRLSGHIADGRVQHWQVTIKAGFTLEGDDVKD